jgi:hypothetical protein
MNVETNNVFGLVEQRNKRTAKIIKCQKKDNFTRIYNACINDKNLSGEALAVLVYIMSKPEDWVVYVHDLCVRFKRSSNKIYALINELTNLGYMRRYQPRNENGTVLPWVTEASDEPIFLKGAVALPLDINNQAESLGPRQLSPHINLPQAVKTGRGEMNTTKKEYTNKKYKQKNNNNREVISNKDKLKIEPEESVVVVLMKRLQSLAISKVLVTSWLKKHGMEYIIEKIELTENRKPRNPEGFLNRAIAQDWKPALPRQSEDKGEGSNEPIYPSHDENVAWYGLLTDEDKFKHLQLAIFKYPMLEAHLKHQQISILDATFSDHGLFKMFMSLLGRAR